MNEIIPMIMAILTMALIPIGIWEFAKAMNVKYKRYRDKKQYLKFVDVYVKQIKSESFPPNSSVYTVDEWSKRMVFDNRTTLQKYCNHTNEIKEETQPPASELW